MKIALVGYGKMGKIIERLALEAGDEVVLKVSRQNAAALTADNLRIADVAIEFSSPESAYHHVMACLEAGIPVVCGSTGWLDRLNEVKTWCRNREGAFLYASNFSIGVNLFFALNRYLAALMHQQPQYNVNMEEIHHTQKLDAPSGTAISLANDVLANHATKNRWVNTSQQSPDELAIISQRVDNVPGTHIIEWSSPVDSIEIKHTAHSREGFAAGALAAARWLAGKQGCFEMKDVLGF
jgi:4-hydroxy-tetrahydrodipicolinate reductase